MYIFAYVQWTKNMAFLRTILNSLVALYEKGVCLPPLLNRNLTINECINWFPHQPVNECQDGGGKLFSYFEQFYFFDKSSNERERSTFAQDVRAGLPSIKGTHYWVSMIRYEMLRLYLTCVFFVGCATETTRIYVQVKSWIRAVFY